MTSPDELTDADCWLTLDEAARYTLKSRGTVSRARAAGVLIATPRPLRIRLDHFNAFLRRQYPLIAPLTPATLQDWRAVEADKARYRWCRSLHHEWVHQVDGHGHASCEAKIPLGSAWIPVPSDEMDLVRLCKRCRGRERGGRDKWGGGSEKG